MSENLATILTETSAKHGDRIAFKLDDVELPYKFLNAAAAGVANLLADRGVEPGDRVGLMLPNVPYFPVLYYGILRAGAIVVPMNVLLKEREVAYYLGDSGAKLLFAWHGFGEAAEAGAAEAGTDCILVEPGKFEELVGGYSHEHELVERSADDTAVILYTSGTTGKPKGAELTHANLLRNCRGMGDFAEIDENTVLLGALPLFHSFGQTCTMNCAISSGAMVTMIPRFDPEKALEIIERDGVTIFQGVPTMYNAMLHARRADETDVATLGRCMSGGAAIPVELIRGFEEKFDCIILEGYGLSETSPVACFNHPNKERKAGSIGTPIEGVEMQIWDDNGNELPQGEVGEIVIRGHNIMKGYWERPDATEESVTSEGWFRSGDMARVDEDGYFFIVDRKKDMIIRGGYNVYPREVEEVLYEHPAVQEAAVVAVPDEALGEEVGAAVVLKEGESLEASDLREHVRSQVAAYKYPRRIWFVDELPKGPTGKILKREIEVPEQAPTASAGS
ncbi:MAG TPA: long-chain fatty acid--CoA ligase [Thermoleophilaceae bacterium]|nr:long-chain fatty acid--CoA ligase [Thermoleophilaceae bacterium]